MVIQRLWRRAVVLTGDRQAAQWVVATAITSTDNPLKMNAFRRDRLVTQRAREAARRDFPGERSDGLALEGAAAQVWSAAHALPRLQMEAWTLRVLEGLEEIPAARALDCSRSAMNAALAEGETALRALTGDQYLPAVDTVRRALAELDATGAVDAIAELRRATRFRRRLITTLQLTLFAACVGVLVWVGYDLLQSDRLRDRPNPEAERLSAPMPDTAPAQVDQP